MLSQNTSAERRCGECSLCCTVLRVDELRKLGGSRCRHQLDRGGCGIHATRPQICRAYRCLWLTGSFEEADRPDRLGAVVDLLTVGDSLRLSIQEGGAGAYDASPRLQEIAASYRVSMPVRIVEAGAFSDPDRPFRVLLPDGDEQRVRGEIVATYREGIQVGESRLPWLDRLARRTSARVRAWRQRGMR